MITIDGVGRQTAERLVAELGDPARFRSSAGLASYVGVTLRVHQPDNESSLADPGPGNSASTATYYTYNTVTLASGALFDELTSVEDPVQNVTTYGYDASGNLISVTDPTQARVARYTFYSNGLVKTATDPKQNPPATYAYYPSGDLQTETDPLGHTTQYVTDQLGRVTSVTGPAGDITSYQYDALDDVTGVTDPNGNVKSASYDLLGEVASTTDAKGTTTYNRPYTLNKLTITDPLGYTTVRIMI